MALSPEDREQAEKLLEINERRLRVRDRQIEHYGDNVAPEVVIDAEDIRRKIVALKAVLEPELPDEISGLVKRRAEDDYFLFQQVLGANLNVAKLREDVAVLKTNNGLAATWRMQADEKFDSLFSIAKQSEDARASGAPLIRGAMLGAFMIAALALVVGCAALVMVMR